MRVSTQFRIGLLVLLVVQILTTFAGLTLLVRMGPAIERIFEANVVSLEAAESMMASLLDQDRTRFVTALTRADANITAKGEKTALEGIHANFEAAFNGNEAATQDTRVFLLQLGAINREAMIHADLAEKRLATAGIWVMVILGLTGYASYSWVSRRFRKSVQDPLEEVVHVVRSASRGDMLRRCSGHKDLVEFRELASGLNRLLDDSARVPGDIGGHRGLDAEHAALLILLEEQERPIVVANGDEILAANAAARDLLFVDAAWKNAILSRDPERLERIKDLPGEIGFVTWLRIPADPEEDSAGTPA